MSSTWTGRVIALISVSVIAAGVTANLSADVLDRFGPPKMVHLETVLANPHTYMNTTLRIPVRFAAYQQLFIPVYTRFQARRYLNFSAWSTNKRLWKKDEVPQIYPYWYVRKDNPEFKTFLRFKRFDTLLLMVRLHDILKDTPCFEVVAVTRLPGTLTQEELLHIRHAYADLKHRRYDKALEHLLYLKKEVHLPKDLRARLQRELALLYVHGLRDYKRGLWALREAVALNPGDRGLKKLYHWVRHHRNEGDPPKN